MVENTAADHSQALYVRASAIWTETNLFSQSIPVPQCENDSAQIVDIHQLQLEGRIRLV